MAPVSCTWALPNDYVDLEVFHSGVQDLLYCSIEAVYLIDEQYISLIEVGDDGSQISSPLYDGARSCLELYAHLVGNDMGQGRLAQAGWTSKQYVVKAFASGLGSFDKDLEVVEHSLLTYVFGQGLGAQ